jgi:hypothetical protein
LDSEGMMQPRVDPRKKKGRDKVKNYDGQEMVVRETNRSKYQVIPVPHTPHDLSCAPVFTTQAEAKAYISRPMPKWVATGRELTTKRMKYHVRYADILSRPELREMRREIQRLYETMAWASKLAAAHQRAAAHQVGKVSSTGRSVEAAWQANADYQADEATTAAHAWNDAVYIYEIAVQQAMSEAGIPVVLFRSPAVVTSPQTNI